MFGSIARHEDVSGSDIDLLVRFAPDVDLFDLAEEAWLVCPTNSSQGTPMLPGAA